MEWDYTYSDTVALLPCKYPRLTRFITSLAVKLATSSKEQGGKKQSRKRRRTQGSSQQHRNYHAHKKQGSSTKNIYIFLNNKVKL